MPVIRGADCLRRSLVPSLLAVRRTNEALANTEIELFEIAKVYLPQGGELPHEEMMLAITSGRGYLAVKGAIEAILDELKIAAPLAGGGRGHGISRPGRLLPRADSATRRSATSGRLHAEALQQFDLRGPTTVAEIKLSPLVEAADLVPRCCRSRLIPAVTRDLNLVVDEAVRWADVAATVREHGGPCFESLEYRDTYRDPQRLGRKEESAVFDCAALPEGTFTSQAGRRGPRADRRRVPGEAWGGVESVKEGSEVRDQGQTTAPCFSPDP